MNATGMNRAARRSAAKAQRRHTGRRVAAGLGAVGLAATGVVMGAAPASAQTFTVINLSDSGPGSLRDAIEDANVAPGADVITFASTLTGTITLTTGELVIAGPLTIEGPGSDKLSVSGNDESRIFHIVSSSDEDGPLDDVTIKSLTITHGYAPTDQDFNGGNGGAVYLVDPVNFTLSDAVVSDSVAEQDGGGIYAHPDGGSVTISTTAITGNTADSYGGGLFVEHTLATLTGLMVTGNTARYGGGIYSDAAVTLDGSTVSGNDAEGGTGGGLYVSTYAYEYGGLKSDGASITNTVISGNTATYSGGGLLLDTGNGSVYTGGGTYAWILTTTTLSGLTIDGNSAVYGGGIGVQGAGAVDVTDTTISNNTAEYGGGVAASASGGASALAAVVIPKEESGLLSIGFVNSTIAGNKATRVDTVTAVALSGASASFDHATVAGNTGDGPAIAVSPRLQQSRTAGAQGADRSDADEDGRYRARPDAVAEPQVEQLPPATVTLRNSIAYNPGSETDLSDGDFSVSYSLVGKPGAQPVATGTAGNLVGVDPLLGVLADNGGLTLTMLPGAGSPVINSGNAAVGVAPALDQRGLPRVSGAATDMGAVEVQLALVATGPVDAVRNDGESVSFTAAATGDPTITVQWQVSADGGATWANVAGATEPTLTFTALLEQDGRRFRAVFTNAAGSVTTDSALLTVLSPTPPTPPMPPTTPSPPTTTPVATQPILAATGAEANRALPLGAALVAMGAAMTAFARRRRV